MEELASGEWSGVQEMRDVLLSDGTWRQSGHPGSGAEGNYSWRRVFEFGQKGGDVRGGVIEQVDRY